MKEKRRGKNTVVMNGNGKGWRPCKKPTHFHENYTDEQKQQVCDVIDWINKNQKTSGWLCSTARLNRSTLYRVLDGEYPGNIHRFLKPCLDTIRSIEIRGSDAEAPFISTSTSELIHTACARARRYRSFAIITGEVGTGKTRCLKEYAAANSNTLVVESDPNMSPTAMMEDLSKALHLTLPKGYASRERRFRVLLDAVKDTDILIIADEAEHMSELALHYLRRLRDKGRIGVVLSGNPKLHALIAPEGGQFDQIRSRTCFWPKTIRAITPDDAIAVAQAMFAELDVDEATQKALWHYCKGSMRVLTEDLIPAIKDFGLKKHKLSADLVHSVARKALSLG